MLHWFTALNAAIQVLIALGGAGITIAGWVRYVRPRLHQWRADKIAVRDALIGRPAIMDSIQQDLELVPALPGIGQRMATTETAVAKMAESLQQVADQQAEIIALRADTDSNTTRILALEDAQAERLVTRAESLAHQRVIEAALHATTDPLTPDQPDHEDIPTI